jgi:hypothetical protein
MAAAPQNGLLTFRGDQTGRFYSYNIYNSDVANAFITWNTAGTAGTTTTNFVIAPENMTLVDASIVTGLTDTKNMVLWLNDGPVPSAIIMDANIVNTVATRAFPPMKIAAGRKVQFQEV